MKHLVLCIAVISAIFLMPTRGTSQIREKAEGLLNAVITDNKTNEIPADSASAIEDKVRLDSIRLQELELQVQEMKLNEIVLRNELNDALHRHITTDSLKKEEQRRSIDSLRTLTPGVPLVIDNDTLLTFYAKRGGVSAHDRAENAVNLIQKIGKDLSLKTDSVSLFHSEYQTDIMYGEKVILSVTDQDAVWQNTEREELAKKYQTIVNDKILSLKKEHGILQVTKRVTLFILVLVVQYFLFKLTNYLFRKLRRRIIWLKQNKLKSITIREYEFLNTHRQGRILIFLNNILRYIVLLIQLMFSVPMLFAIFPQTENLAMKLFSYILEPVKMVLKSVIEYIPNLFIIVVIYYCVKYIIKGIQYIANEIESEKLKITGFYPDWAQPSFNIIRFLLYAFMIAMIYPYLPGSDSGVFQGISVFVGLIVSLGSSTVIGNIIAGLVITYMRPFKLGDRIKLNETTGNVIEKTPFVTRIRTPKNEVVTIPNSFIMSSHTVNYSASARQFGLIIHSTVSIGYDIPWRQVHQLLIDAARSTPGVQPHPKPFVLETELQDYYPCYQINAYIKDADRLSQIYSDLHQNIQDVFNEAGIEIMSPHYYAERDGSAVTIPPEYQQKPDNPDKK
ncbi:mechanosensitive ion channel family protein [uncultured Parabacteroides sp.]|uniref:mechanosensitive ion channel family protein n=1 Tax=uncultured Parabacteroides sp. TaxID=512312 RepID=UPI00258F7CD7|nr:mechanosensitive ion channel family protein [uncultured Parabacteroides sp.]